MDVGKWIDGNTVLAVNVKMGEDTFLTVEAMCDGRFQRVEHYYTGDGSGGYETRYYPIGGLVLDSIRISVGEPSENTGGTAGAKRSAYFDWIRVEDKLPGIRHMETINGFGGTAPGELPMLWTDETGSGSWIGTAYSNEKVLSQTSAASGQECMVTTGADIWEDCVVSMDVKPGSTASSTSQGIVFRYADSDNYYEALLENGYVKINKTVSGITTNLLSTAFTFNTSEYYNLSVEARGYEFKVYIDGEQKGGTVRDSSLSNGKVGARTYGASAMFDNLFVESIY